MNTLPTLAHRSDLPIRHGERPCSAVLRHIYNPPGVAYFDGVPNAFAPGFKGSNQVSNPFDWDSGYPGVFQPGNKNSCGGATQPPVRKLYFLSSTSIPGVARGLQRCL